MISINQNNQKIHIIGIANNVVIIELKNGIVNLKNQVIILIEKNIIKIQALFRRILTLKELEEEIDFHK